MKPGQADSNLMLEDPLLDTPDGWLVRLGNHAVPLPVQGEHVRCPLPGWRASLLHTGFVPLFLLELVHADGREATWYPDFRMEHVGDAVEQLGTELSGCVPATTDRGCASPR